MTTKGDSKPRRCGMASGASAAAVGGFDVLDVPEAAIGGERPAGAVQPDPTPKPRCHDCRHCKVRFIWPPDPTTKLALELRGQPWSEAPSTLHLKTKREAKARCTLGYWGVDGFGMSRKISAVNIEGAKLNQVAEACCGFDSMLPDADEGEDDGNEQ